MKWINSVITLVILTVTFNSSLYSQTDEIECLREFNLFVYQSLVHQYPDIEDLTSNTVKLIFELEISKCGKVKVVNVRKSNLIDLSIDEKKIVGSIVGKKISCLQEIYYSDRLKPRSLIIVYNTELLEN